MKKYMLVGAALLVGSVECARTRYTVAQLKDAIINYDTNYSKSQYSPREGLEEIAMMIKKLPHKDLNKEGTETPLMVAAERGMVEVTRVLLANGTLPDVKDKKGHDALWFAQHACKSGHCKEVVEIIKDSHRKAGAKKEHKRARKSTSANRNSKPIMHMPA